jgi:PHD-zinc-finger like domain
LRLLNCANLCQSYECVLCPVRHTEQTLVEPPKVSHKKKTDREREKERQEKELCEELEQRYTQSQEAKGKPIRPREALKRTADNKWVHVSCALWTPEIRFSNAITLDVAEGIPLIPRVRREQHCKLCKTANGACVSCHHCHANFHVACAYKQGYSFGFDVTPVKSSRRDGVNIVTLGPETGTMTAAIWCADHGSSAIKTIVHYLNEQVEDSGKIALQLFAENYKQADLTLTGTARKANYLDEITKSHAPAVQPVPTGGNRRFSTTASVSGNRTARNSSAGLSQPKEENRDSDTRVSTPQKDKPDRRCITCNIDVSPKWWKHVPKIKRVAQPVASASAPVDVHMSNGLNHDILPSKESPMQFDGPQLSNGHAIELPEKVVETNPAPVHGNSLDAILIAYDCNKCHWRLLSEPEDVEEPESEVEARPTTVERTTSPPLQHSVSLWSSGPHMPPQQHPSQHGLPQQQQVQSWRTYPNGLPLSGLPNGAAQSPPPVPLRTGMSGRSPPPTMIEIRHHPYHPPPIGGQHPSYLTGNGSGMPARPAYTSASHAAPLLNLVSGLPNGLSSQHGQPLRSPTHPGPSMHGIHRQSDGSYNGGPPARQSGPYSYMDRSPTQATATPRPSTPRDVPAIPTASRVHGASASPSVHNILND